GISAVSNGAWPGNMPMSPSVPVATSDSTRPEKIWASLLAISQCIVMAMMKYSLYACFACWINSLLGQFGRSFYRFFDVANHVKRLFRQVVVVAGQNSLEATDGVFERYVL